MHATSATKLVAECAQFRTGALQLSSQKQLEFQQARGPQAYYLQRLTPQAARFANSFKGQCH